MVSRRRGTRERKAIGIVAKVLVIGPRGKIPVSAKIDTGAARTTLDTDLVAKAGLGPVMDHLRILTSAADEPEERDLVQAKVIIAGREFDVAVEVTDRKDMRYHMIVGMDTLRESGFLMDPSEGNGPENGARASPHPTSFK